MPEQRRTRFLTYLCEFLVVVLGVTVSFGLDSWRQSRQQTALHGHDVQSILADLSRDQEHIAEVQAHIEQGEAAGDHLDYISIHSYWLPLWQKQETPDYLTCISYSERPEEQITEFVGVLEESGYRGKVKIAFDEWCLRGWHHPGFPRKSIQDYDDPEVQALIKAREKNDLASQYTMADALFSASFLNACLRHADDVAMANIAPIVNTRGPLFVHPKGVVRRAHFHTMAMYANELEPRVAPLERRASNIGPPGRRVPVVDAVATVNASGDRWSIALVNRHPSEAVACTGELGDAMLEGAHPAALLTADSHDAYNDIDNPSRVAPAAVKQTFERGVTMLPPHSLTIVKVARGV